MIFSDRRGGDLIRLDKRIFAGLAGGAGCDPVCDMETTGNVLMVTQAKRRFCMIRKPYYDDDSERTAKSALTIATKLVLTVG